MPESKPEEIYAPYAKDNPEVSKLMVKARKTNKKRSADERRNGWASPDISINSHIRTAMCAIGCGIACIARSPHSEADLACVAEGLAMLEEIELLLRKLHPEN